jgi:hypothetical protein
MNKFRLTVKLLVIATFMLAFASIAQAQATRTWVSGVGDDVNPCSRTAPCKTFAGAISKTAACGEISVLDPGGFGAVTITKSITIDGTGTLAGILAAGTTGIIVNAAATDVVTIRGVSINGACTGIRGMNIIQAKTVNVEDVVIFRFVNEGILVAETSSTELNLNIRNTVIRDNAGAGLKTSSTTGLVKVSIADTRLSGNLFGIHSQRGSRVTAQRIVVSNSGSVGLFADGNGATCELNVSKSIISNNPFGAQAGGGTATALSVIRVNDSDLFDNTSDALLVSTNGEIDTFQNNRVLGNGVNTCAACTPKTPL